MPDRRNHAGSIRARALVVPHKIERVYNYHRATLHALPNSLPLRGSITRSRSGRSFLAAHIDHRGAVVRAALSVAAPGRTDRRHQAIRASRALGDGAGETFAAAG